MTKAEAFYDRLVELTADSGGTVSRMISLRQILEAVYKDMSADSKTAFTGLFARMQYVHERLDLTSQMVSQANELRILCNKIAHEEMNEVPESLFSSGLLVLSRLLELFYEEHAPQALTDWLNANSAALFLPRANSKKHSFNAVVDSWMVTKDERSETGLKLCVCGEDGQMCSIVLYNDLTMNNEGRRWSLLGRCIWKNAVLSCLNLSQSSSGENLYISNPNTLIVLEPDFLLDASSLSEAFSNNKSNPESYVLSRLFREPSSDKMLLGQTVNHIFDEMISDPEAEYNDLFRSSLATNSISMVALQLDTALNVYKTIEKDHLPQIKSFIKNLGSPEIMLEPSFICPQYGLQGRLDLLYKQKDKYWVVELKSGKPPAINTWKPQQMQVIAYNMIIRNCFGRANLGGSAIYYSASQENPARFVENYIALEQDLIMCRNRIVGIMRQLSQDPRPFFDYLRTGPDLSDNPIQKKKMQDFTAFALQLEDHEYEWFLEQVKRIILEAWYVKTGSNRDRDDSIYGHNALWQESKQQKQNSYKIITDLTIQSCAGNLIRLLRTGTGYVDDFRLGDIIVMYRQSKPIENQQIFRGVINSLEEDSLTVTIRGGVKNTSSMLGKDLWCLEHDVLETMLFTPLASIVTFLSGSREIRSTFLGVNRPRFTALHDARDCSIEALIERIKSAKDYFVIQGPPGTGKTSGLLKGYISDLYSHTNKNLLILSFTNRAVDEICNHLSQAGIPFIRTGASQSVEIELLSQRIKGKSYEEINSVIRTNRIWLSTVQSCNSWITDFLQITHFDELIIDEASQIIEPSILGIIAKAGKTILIGDQNQLPPITAQSANSYHFISPVLEKLCYTTFNQSLMERLYRLCIVNGWTEAVSMLSLHYRMHEDIAELVNEYYDNRLICASDRQKQAVAPGRGSLLSHRVIWIDCPVTSQNHYDLLHAKAILAILEHLETTGSLQDVGKEVGIIAPYRAMIHCLWQELPSKFKDITIDTVERFQGSERKVMILTLPLKSSTDLRTVESLSSDGAIDRKLNVAVSRSREQLIIIGNADLCSVSLHYRNVIDKIRRQGICIHIDKLDAALAE